MRMRLMDLTISEDFYTNMSHCLIGVRFAMIILQSGHETVHCRLDVSALVPFCPTHCYFTHCHFAVLLMTYELIK